MGKMYSLEEQLSVLTPEQLEALKQEMIKIRDAEIEKENKGKVRGLVGKGILRGLAAFGEGAVLGLQNRPISEGSFMRERPASMAEVDDLEAFEEKERIKRRVGQEFEEPGIRLKDMDIPEGYEIVGYDQKGQPMVRKKQPTLKEKEIIKAEGRVLAEREKQKAQAETDFLMAKNKLATTIGAFKAMIQSAGGAGRIPGFVGSELAGRAGINPYAEAYKGQLVEAAAALAKLAAPSARVGQDIIAQFKKTLPTTLSTEKEALNQIRFSLHNAFATVLAKNGKSYDKETRAKIDEMFDEVANTPALTLDSNNINPERNSQETIKKVGRFIIEE